MSSEARALVDPLLWAARALGQSTDLEPRLAVLAGAAAALTGGVSHIHLAAEDGSTLHVAAASPAPGDDGSRDVPVDAADGIAVSFRDRREVVSGEVEHESVVLGQASAGALAVHLPLVLERQSQSPDVEGVLTVVTSERPDAPVLDALRAVAVLAAVAAQQSRLEATLGERSDWLDRLAHTDPLTGLANRRTLDRVLELELARAARQGSQLCVALFGVESQDDLSRSHGAGAADDVLRRVAAVLAETVRLVDTVARYGRAEFVVVAPGSTGLAMANRAAAAIARLDPTDSGQPVSVSVGVASFPVHGTTSEELLTAAERALDGARQQGAPIAAAD